MPLLNPLRNLTPTTAPTTALLPASPAPIAVPTAVCPAGVDQRNGRSVCEFLLLRRFEPARGHFEFAVALLLQGIVALTEGKRVVVVVFIFWFS